MVVHSRACVNLGRCNGSCFIVPPPVESISPKDKACETCDRSPLEVVYSVLKNRSGTTLPNTYKFSCTVSVEALRASQDATIGKDCEMCKLSDCQCETPKKLPVKVSDIIFCGSSRYKVLSLESTYPDYPIMIQGFDLYHNTHSLNHKLVDHNGVQFSVERKKLTRFLHLLEEKHNGKLTYTASETRKPATEWSGYNLLGVKKVTVTEGDNDVN